MRDREAGCAMTLGPASRVLIVAALVGCGPVVDDEAPQASGSAGGTASGDPSTSTTGPRDTTRTAGEPDDGSSSGTNDSVPLQPDEALCLNYCVHMSGAAGCTLAGEGCYTSCIDRLRAADEQGCGEVTRDVVACESEADIDEWCWSTDGCRDTYIDADFCWGFCSYFDGYPGAGATQDECNWRSDCLEGSVSIEMTCGIGDDPSCECWIDGTRVGECTHEGSLAAFDCGFEQDLHVLNGCCAPFFREVIQ